MTYTPPPPVIVTTHLMISYINYASGPAMDALAVGCVADLETETLQPIEIELDFDTINRLLGAGTCKEAEWALDQVIHSLNEPEQDIKCIDFSPIGALTLSDFIITLGPILEEDGFNGTPCFPAAEDQRYFIRHFIPRPQKLPPFHQLSFGSTKRQHRRYYNTVLLSRILIYNALKHQLPVAEARFFSKLEDPVTFALASLHPTS